MRTLAIAAALLTLATSTAPAQDVVRMGTEGAYPPYNFVNDSNEVDGFERELGDEFCARAKLTCEWVTNDWDSIITNLVSGNYDAIVAAMSITDEREKQISFTAPYVPPAPSAYVALSPDVDVQSAVVAAQTGTVHASYVAQSGAQLVEFASPEEIVAAVRNGQADAAFADKDFLMPMVEESGGQLVWVGDEPKLDKGIGMGLRQSDTELKGKFDAAIQSMKDDGSLNALIKKWFGDDAQVF